MAWSRFTTSYSSRRLRWISFIASQGTHTCITLSNGMVHTVSDNTVSQMAYASLAGLRYTVILCLFRQILHMAFGRHFCSNEPSHFFLPHQPHHTPSSTKSHHHKLILTFNTIFRSLECISVRSAADGQEKRTRQLEGSRRRSELKHPVNFYSFVFFKKATQEISTRQNSGRDY